MQVSIQKYGFAAFALGSLITGLLLFQTNHIYAANIVWALGAALGLTLSLRWLVQTIRTLGMGLALLAMLCAAFGFINPTQSAIVQEFIDVAAICWALVNSKA